MYKLFFHNCKNFCHKYPYHMGFYNRKREITNPKFNKMAYIKEYDGSGCKYSFFKKKLLNYVFDNNKNKYLYYEINIYYDRKTVISKNIYYVKDMITITIMNYTRKINLHIPKEIRILIYKFWDIFSD